MNNKTLTFQLSRGVVDGLARDAYFFVRPDCDAVEAICTRFVLEELGECPPRVQLVLSNAPLRGKKVVVVEASGSILVWYHSEYAEYQLMHYFLEARVRELLDFQNNVPQNLYYQILPI